MKGGVRLTKSSTMEALALELTSTARGKRRKLRVIEVPAPVPETLGPHDVLGETIINGFCLTDSDMSLHEAHGHPTDGLEGLIEGPELVLIGHEAVLRLTWIGEQVTKVRVGDIVAPMVREVRDCDCLPCRIGHPHMCYKSHHKGALMEHGIFRLPGFACPLVAIHEDYVVRIPDGLDPRYGCLAEPSSIAAKAWAHAHTTAGADRDPEFMRYPEWGRSVDGEPPVAVMLGAGGVGLPGVAVLRSLGFEVLVVAYTQHKRGNPHTKAQLVEDIGAHYYSSQECSLDEIIGHSNELSTKKEGPDLAIDMCGDPAFIFQAKRAFKSFPGTVFVNTSITGGSKMVTVDAAACTLSDVMLNSSEISVVNAHNTHFERGLEGIKWADTYAKGWPGRLLTHRFRDLHDAAENLWEIMDDRRTIRSYVQFQEVQGLPAT